MEALHKLCIYVIQFLTCAFCERLELPAYEYLRRFNQPLYLGQCAHRLVQYPDGPFAEPCTFPNRSGQPAARWKEVESQKMIAIHGASQLIQHVGMCNDRSAAYFGLLLSKEDCLANDIAGKMSFKPKTAIWMYKEHFRPKVIMLNATPGLDDIPNEFSLYLDNLYYTEHIGIGTEELIIVEMQFKSVDEAENAYRDRHKKMSKKLVSIAKHAGPPRRVKVTRLSTSDNIFETEVFKNQFAIYKAVQYVEKCERHIERIKQELKVGLRTSHLRYGFKAYEIKQQETAQHTSYPQLSDFNTRSSVTLEDKQRMNWEDVAVLQIEAKRIHAEHRKYRKFCRSKMKRHKCCLLLKQTLRTLKKAVTKIHVQRREWSNISFYQQSLFIEKENQRLKILKDRAKWLAKEIRTLMKKKP